MNDYQKRAARTLIDAPDFDITDGEIMIVWNAIGLAGEAGEVVDSIKKSIFHQQGINLTELSKELGDVLWYVAALCTTLGLDMSEVMEKNIKKLEARYPNGYNPADSVARVDTQQAFDNGRAVGAADKQVEQPQ